MTALLIGITVALSLGIVANRLTRFFCPSHRREFLLSVLTLVCALPLLQAMAQLSGIGWHLSATQPPIAGTFGAWQAMEFVWFLGCIYLVSRVIWELWCSRQFSTHGRPLPGHSLPVFVSSSVSSACVSGILRPRVYLPTCCEGWSAETMDLVLKHESCHLRSHDARWLLLAELFRAALWVHPLAHLFVRDIRQSIEDACDEAVLANGTDRRMYAVCLLEVAANHTGSPLLAAAMSSPGMASMKLRLGRILTAAPSSEAQLPRLLFALGLGVTVALTACHREALDESNLKQEAAARLAADPFPG